MPTPTTVSTCTPVTDQGTHDFHIFGYREYRGMGIGEFIWSGAFSVGGHKFAVTFYPDGFNSYTSECISIRPELLSCKDDETKVRACCDLRLLGHTTGLPCSVWKTEMTMLSPADRTRRFTSYSMERNTFEASPYLKDDHIIIDCIVTVKQPWVSKTEFLHGIEVPPSNIKKQLGELLDAAEECGDVTFSVRGETFGASRKVLALRSPVFKAELYGPMREARVQHLTIEDMQPAVFRALLHFINTDSLPADVDRQHHGGDSSTDCEMIWHLLEAADRYAVDRLKVVCESILCKNLDAETVSTTLALASQHNCDKCKENGPRPCL